MLNKILLNSAQKIVDDSSPAQFHIYAHFINSDPSSNFSFYPFEIKSLTINKDFLENFGDEIDLTCIISPKDYALLQDQGQNLLCVLTLTYLFKNGNPVFNPKPVQKQYNVMINDPRDIRKAIPDVHLYVEPSASLELSVRLIEPTIYKLRHTKINAIYPSSTVENVIYAITQFFGIGKIHLVPPDNKQKYDHIPIPSYQGIGSVFGYLQSKCGVYEKGMNSYITDGVLYIYPPFETNPVYDKTVSFYQVSTGRYAGITILHRLENKSLSIVINSQPHSYDLSIAGAEDVGTGFIFTRASRMSDGFSTIDTKKGAQYTENSSLTISLNNSRPIVKDINNIFHIKATDNPYPAMSEIIAHQASLMEVIWTNADPFFLDPGHTVNYYYDENGKMVRKTGILERVTYVFKALEKIGPKTMFGASASLILRLSPNTTQII